MSGQKLRHLMRRKLRVREPFGGLEIEIIVDLKHNVEKDLLVLTAHSPDGEKIFVERLEVPKEEE